MNLDYTSLEGTERWKQAGKPMPTSSIRVDIGECAFDCGRVAYYLVKIETESGITAKTRVCEECNAKHRIWAERYLPPETKRVEQGG